MTQRTRILRMLAGILVLGAFLGIFTLVSVPEPVKAQGTLDTSIDAYKFRHILYGPPKPNECPVCGTMAPPYKRPRFYSEVLPCNPPHQLDVCPEKSEPYGPAERIVRCYLCNTAFWQDADDKVVKRYYWYSHKQFLAIAKQEDGRLRSL